MSKVINKLTANGKMKLVKKNKIFLEIKELFENDDDEGIDPVVTGSIRSNASAPTKDQARIFQERRRPAPVSQKGQQSDIQLVFATRGRALIRDGDDLLPVAIGSRLPDGSIVKSVARSNNQWTLLTSTNQVLELSN